MAFTHFPISFIITFLLFLIPKTTTTAATSPIPSPPPPSNSTTTTTPPTNISTAAQDYTNAHNKARSEVKVPPLTWNNSLATTATNLARYQRIKFRCDFADLNSSSGGVRRYGANQALASGREVTPREAVEYWVKEKVYYNREMNKCVNGHGTCGVYTQVVWNKSKELGCAQTVCGGKEGKSLTICLYYPPGNVIGETPY